MWRTIAAILTLSALLSAQSTRNSGIHKEDMDPACKPCADFWRFVNGGWIDKNPIPPDKAGWGTFAVLADVNRERMRTILEGAAADNSAPAGSTGRKMSDFYSSCMNTALIDQRGITPLRPDFDRIAAIQSRKDVAAVLTRFQEISSPADGSNLGLVVGPFRLGAQRDPRDPSRVIAQVEEHAGAGGARTSIFSLPDRDYYFRDDPKSRVIRDEFLRHVATMLSLAGTSGDTSAQARTVLAFETELARAAMTNAERRDPDKVYHLMDVNAANALTPGFDWKVFLLAMDLPEGTLINVAQPELLKKFNKQLTTVPLDDWKTWLRWRVLDVSAPYLSKRIADEAFHFDSGVLSGIAQQPPRWETCSRIIDRDMGDALGQAYAAKYFPPEAKQHMGMLVENLRGAMREQLQNSDWLEPATRENAIRKLDAFTVKIGNPDRWRDYSALNIDPGKYFENTRAAWRHNQRYQLSKIGKPPDRLDWNMTPPTVNAYSNSSQVEVVFPAGILQPPFFDLTADDAANYGAIGAVIGHEMGHQFGDGGSKFDSTGKLNDWWTPADRAKFNARAACVVDQFNTIDVGEGLHHNGRLVLGEAMGDLGGLSIAYKAYRRSLAGKPEPPVMDGYTADQRFFIAFARVWGTAQTPEATRLQVATNPHPLAQYRANATLGNIPEFQRAFMCMAGDPMVRPASQQCRLW